MIFVTIGTQDKEFSRLLKAVEQLETDEEIIIQKGSTKFNTNKSNIKIFDYIASDEFEKYMEEARMIITHAGVGTIIQGLKMHKKLIVAARLKKYKEHVNDHQLELLKSFSEEGYILPLVDFKKLTDLIEQDFIPKEFKSNKNIFNENLFKTIEKI